MQPIELEEMQLPTKTYLVQDGRIMTMVDNHPAMVQAIDKALKTARYSVPWQSPNYGHDLDDLIGKSIEYARMEIERMVVETFDSDDRVEEVSVFNLEQTNKTTLVAHVEITTIYGEIKTEVGVTANDTE